MANVRFYLKSGGGSAKLIFLYFSYNNNRLKYSTRLKVAPEYWNEEKQQIRETAKFGIDLARSYNEQLKGLARHTEQIHLDYLNKGKVIAPDELRAELDKVTGKTKDAPARGLIAYIEQFIEKRAASPKYSVSSIKVYRCTLNRLKEFGKAKRQKIDFDLVDLEFLENFRDYLYSKNFAENYVHKLVSTFKTFLIDATEEGVNTNLKFQTKRLGLQKENVPKIYLTLDELQRLYELDLSNNSRLARVRDLFVIGAFTGLRFSDFTQIRPEHFREVEGVEVLQIDTQKTGERVIIPVHPFVRGILAHNGGQPPKGITNQKMNLYLKELGQLAEINEPIIISKKIGGVKTAQSYRKYELLSTHTARRSFATNAFKEGESTISIMAVTGHKTETAFMRYIQITKEENAVRMSKNKFFNISPLRVAK